MEKIVDLPDHIDADSAVGDDGQVLPHPQLLRREDALDGAQEEAVMFNLGPTKSSFYFLVINFSIILPNTSFPDFIALLPEFFAPWSCPGKPR